MKLDKKQPWIKQAHGNGFGETLTLHDGCITPDLIRTPGGYNVHRAHYRSLDHLVDVTNRALPASKVPSFGREKKWRYGNWSRKATYTALAEGRSADPNAQDVFQRMRDAVKARMIDGKIAKCRTAIRQRSKSWGGGSLNVGRYMASLATGIPAPVYDVRTRRAERPIIRIGINVSMSCGNELENFTQLAANAAAMAEAFESMGYGVQIVGMSVNLVRGCHSVLRKYTPAGEKCKPYDEWWSGLTWDLKSADDPLDTDRILSIGMPGLLRDVIFRAKPVALAHGVMNAACKDCPTEVAEACDVDVLLERSWSRTNRDEQNADRIVGKINELLAKE